MAKRTCSIDGCQSTVMSRGWCSMHYQRWAVHGDPLIVTVIRTSQKGLVCTVDGCDSPARKRGWCGKHYATLKRTGDPTTPPKIIWGEGTSCQVCGGQLMAGSRTACSHRCQGILNRSRHNPLAIARFIPCALCGSAIDLFTPGIQHSTNRISTSGYKRRADSKFCADCARQKKLRHKYSVQALAARDGTDCGICGNPVDMQLRSPDPMSPTVDHVIPVGVGGPNDPTNYVLTHKTCNQRKNIGKAQSKKSTGERRHATQRWKKLSRLIRAAEPNCRLCGSPAWQTDHILAIIDGGDMWDTANLQPLCRSCGNTKSVREYRRRVETKHAA